MLKEAKEHVVCQEVYSRNYGGRHIYKPPTAICNTVFYASNNKSIGVAKAIDNMFHVVKDRI